MSPTKPQDTPAVVKSQSTSQTSPPLSRMRRLFGFELSDLSSVHSFIALGNRPMDPSSLAATRVMYGTLMFLDAFMERGLHTADVRWGDKTQCQFPLINSLHPLPLEWMYMVYLSMLIGSFGILIGLFYRFSCVLFMVPYWYIFLLDKQRWNNHSYLFGLLGIMFFFIDANRAWSLDGLRNRKNRNAHVPLWNYGLLRTQFFLVYFIASVKKLDPDWWMGFSQDHLSHHWAFQPFTYVMSDYYIDLLIVHIGGLFIDGFIGFFLFFDKTRPLGFMMGITFNVMNSQIFSIGMFPYAMLSTLPIFCYADWPKKVVSKLPALMRKPLMITDEPQPSDHCYYIDDKLTDDKNVDDKPAVVKARSTNKPSRFQKRFTTRHIFTICGVCLYICWQLFMPFSHGITQGYNNWTNGLYGYSWDMMVHHWKTQHVRITYTVKDTGVTGYLKPQMWSKSNRWSSHADMLKQYASCIEERLVDYDITNIELKFDIWRSLNDRFQQRSFDPRVDILEASWHPFRKTDFVLPLLVDYSGYRAKMAEVEKDIYQQEHIDVVFIADFPGLTLENYVQPELGNVSVTLWKGKVMVELVNKGRKNITLNPDEKLMLPPGEFHNIHTISDEPSCYMYIFVNETARQYIQNMTEYEQLLAIEQETNNEHDAVNSQKNVSIDNIKVSLNDSLLAEQYKAWQTKKESIEIKRNVTNSMKESMKRFVSMKYQMLHRSFSMLGLAMKSIYSQRPMLELIEEMDGGDDEPTEEFLHTEL